jgi:N-glycosylase/DNA lyase
LPLNQTGTQIKKSFVETAKTKYKTKTKRIKKIQLFLEEIRVWKKKSLQIFKTKRIKKLQLFLEEIREFETKNYSLQIFFFLFLCFLGGHDSTYNLGGNITVSNNLCSFLLQSSFRYYIFY